MHHPRPTSRPLTRVRRAAGITLTCIALTLTGCATSSDTNASAQATPISEDEAFAIADATYRAYIDALNQVDLSDPATFEEVYRWSTAETRRNVHKRLTTFAAENVTVSGQSLVTLASLRSFDAIKRIAVIDVCVDVSTITLLDDSGNSRVSADRPDVQRMQVTVQDLSKAPLVTSVGPRENGPTCA